MSSSSPQRPWEGGGWDTLVLVPRPWWRRRLARPLVALFVLLVLSPFGATIWLLVQADHGRAAVTKQFYDEAMDGLTAGTCVDTIGKGDEQSLRPVSCARPHDGEIVGVVPLTPGAYPGEDQVVEQSDQLCADAMDSWVADGSGADLELSSDYFYPSPAGWDESSPTTVCFATRASGDKLVGSLRWST